MSFSFRKSKKIGPFRLNLSSSGIGASVGIKGARLGTGPSGTYVYLSKGGFRYRKKINASSKKSRTPIKSEIRDNNPNEITQISTSELENLSDVDSLELIDELTTKSNRIYLHKWFGYLPLLLFVLYYFSQQLPEFESKSVQIEYFRISTNGANIRSEPKIKSLVLKIALKGDLIPLKEKGDSWSSVEFEKNEYGYINNSVGEFITTNESIETRIPPATSIINSSLSTICFILLLLWVIFLFVLDTKRKTVRLSYFMDDQFEDWYYKYISFFNEIFDVEQVWQHTSRRHSSNNKYTAGADTLISREKVKTLFTNGMPKSLIQCNVKIPLIGLSDIDLYFLPERLLLKRGEVYAAIFYKNLRIRKTTLRFIEDRKVPRDAEVVDHTWQYVNKDGSPDQRFNHNKRIPICAYSKYHFSCKNGINEVIITSKKNGLDNFTNFLEGIGVFQNKFEKLPPYSDFV